VLTTLAKLVAKFAAGVIDTGGKFAAGVVDTGGKVEQSVLYPKSTVSADHPFIRNILSDRQQTVLHLIRSTVSADHPFNIPK
jgi:hypothetical protein